jgi:hypothetical protein
MKNKSFAFVEILISLGVILTLLITIVSVLNPQELLRKARDNKRIYELNSLNLILNTLTLENPNAFNNIASNTVYISLPDTSFTCASWLSKLPPLPSGWYYRCSNNPEASDGSGWLPINLDIGYFKIKKLPIDPINQPPYYYTFVKSESGYELNAILEAKSNIGPHGLAGTDGGTSLNAYEIGTDLRAVPSSVESGGQRDPDLVLYWSFDEGTSFYAYDYSGNNQTGILRNFRTTISNAESLSGWEGNYIVLDSVNKKEGNYSIKLDFENNAPSPNTTYIISYIPPTPLDFSSATDIAYWLNYNTSTNYINSGQLTIYDSNNNYRYWNIGVNQYWRLYSYSLSYYNGQSSIPPNLKNITKIEFKFTTKSTVGPFYINIDLLAYTKPDSANNNWVAGKAGKAIEFDGIDDYVYFPMSTSALSVLNSGSVSMTNCFWLKRYRLGVSEGLLRTNPDVYNEYWWAYIPPDNKVIFYTAGSTAIGTNLPYVLDQTNIWYFLCFVYDVNASTGYKSQIYINGTRVAAGNPGRGTGGTKRDYALVDGYRGYFKGVIDEVKVWKRALTPEEIQALYNSY